MDIQTLTAFFMWCTLINGGILILWSVLFMAAPNLVYRTQSRWFSLSRENFDLIFYCFLGVFKLLFIFFSLVPWIALSIIG
jgi:hypothetical protein